jgi:three-Cys-motif partner protein
MLRDNDLAKWVYKEHTRVKHALLEKYLRAWMPILGSWNPRIAYFDGFAGRGEYEDGAPGSPILTMRLADELAPRLRGISLRFVERDPENYENLKKAVESELARLAHPEKISVHHTRGDFDETARALLDFAEENGTSLVPSFFFIDPFGFTGVPLQTVGRILATEKTEVFFTFMLRDVSRFLELEQLADQMSGLFGGDCWQEVATRPDRERALVELYRTQLHERANAKYSLHFKVCESDSTATLYYLIHANNNLKGHQIMKWVMFNQGVNGAFAYLGRNDLSERTQTRLFDVNDAGQIRPFLLDRLRGRTLTFDEVQEVICHPWHAEPPFLETHYRTELKAMEKEGLIRVARVTSKTPRGLQGADSITFTDSGTTT